MKTRKLGNLDVSALGLGCMSMSSVYGPAADKAEMIRLIRGAHEVTSRSESLARSVIRLSVILSVK